VRDTVLVGGQERLVPFLKVLGLGKELLKFRADDFSGLGGQGIGKAVDFLAELQELEVKGRV
jgi:hypothetical protein